MATNLMDLVSSEEDLLSTLSTRKKLSFDFQTELTDDEIFDVYQDDDAHGGEDAPTNTNNVAANSWVAINSNASASSSRAATQLEGEAVNVGSGTGLVQKPKRVDIEIPLPWMSPQERALFATVMIDDSGWLGPYRRYNHAGNGFTNGIVMDKKRKVDEVSWSEESDEAPRRNARRVKKTVLRGQNTNAGKGRSSKSRSLESTSDFEISQEGSRRKLRARPQMAESSPNSRDDDMDELAHDLIYDNDHASDGDFFFVQSDIIPQKRKRGRPTTKKSQLAKPSTDSDIEFESRRRSDRTNKVSKNLQDPTIDDSDSEISYAEEEQKVTQSKTARIHEVFQPVTSGEFKFAHRKTCDTCNQAENSRKGPLVHCQGCCYAYHESCMGTNPYVREHRVTKVGHENFVLQCQFCVGRSRGKEARGPKRASEDTCQECHKKGAACAPFSAKKTSKTVEKERLDNGGEDPSTTVPAKLLNNADNIMFRCFSCRRAYHFECLPPLSKTKDATENGSKHKRKQRLDTYSKKWACKTCIDVEDLKIDKLIAWRPTDESLHGDKSLVIEAFHEHELEYLIKWANKSYRQSLWMPGAWVYSRLASASRKSFLTRNFADEQTELDSVQYQSLLKFSKAEAIPESYLRAEIILKAQVKPRSSQEAARYKKLSPREKKEDDRDRIGCVEKIYVKFEGLSYDDVVWEKPPAHDMADYYEAFVAAYDDYLVAKHFQSDPVANIRDRIREFRTLDFTSEIEYKTQPEGFAKYRLMEYQLEGLNWMLYKYRHEESVVLADEMGLGKTIQIVALLKSLILDKPRAWPFLIVVPNATCANWRREIKKWAPELRVVLYYGGQVAQKTAYDCELFPEGSKDIKAHIVVMSYQSASDPSTRSLFKSVKWSGLVVDEAHSLKNDQTNLPKALKSMNIPFSVLLTGTPLQNNKKELFNLLQFIDRKFNAEEMDEEYRDLTPEKVENLHERIRPFFLRRTKAAVLKFLPPMSQIILPLSMSVLQEKLCKSILEKNPQLIRAIFAQTKLKANERTGMNNILLQLRKCLCHPFIYSRSIEDRTVSPEANFRNLSEASSKLRMLEVMLPKLKERGHRVLLFSQFLGQLDILEDFFAGMQLPFQRLDGSMSGLDKQKRIDQFNAPGSPLFAMLLSTRAGGVGINLATADTVIIMDPDWNPHQDIQALARVHRIGQQKKVLCFQLVTQESAEEKIMQIGRQKMALDHVLIETMDQTKEESNPSDIEAALRHGAAALFGEGQERERIEYDSEAVEKLLDRSAEEEITSTDEKTSTHEAAFARAKVWAGDGALKEKIESEEKVVKLSVWDNIIKEREEAAKREEERMQTILGRGGRRRQAANYILEDGGLDSDDEVRDGSFVGGNEHESESSENEGAQTGDDIDSNRNGKGTSGKSDKTDAVSAPPPTRPVKAEPGKSQIIVKLPAKRGRPSKEPLKAEANEQEQNPTKSAAIRPTYAQFQQSGHMPHLPSSSGRGSWPNPHGALRNTFGNTQLLIPPQNASNIDLGRGTGGWNGQAGYSLNMAHAFPSQHGVPTHLLVGIPNRQPDVERSGPALNAQTMQLLGGNLVSDLQLQMQADQVRRQQEKIRTLVSSHKQQNHDKNALQDIIAKGSTTAVKGAPVKPASNHELCLVCHYSHPVNWDCPEMAHESKIRLAIEDIRIMTNLTEEQKQVKKQFLQLKLHALKMTRAPGTS